MQALEKAVPGDDMLAAKCPAIGRRNILLFEFVELAF